MNSKKWIAVIVVVVVVAGISSAFYLPRLLRKPLPYVEADNAVMNVTMSGHFLNYWNGNATFHYYNTTSVFRYHNVSSNLTIRGRFFSFGNGVYGPVDLVGNMIIYGNVSSNLHPNGGLAYISVTGNNTRYVVYTTNAYFGGVPPLEVNVTQSTYGTVVNNYSYSSFNLVNQTNANGYNHFLFYLGGGIGLSAPPVKCLVTIRVSLSGFANPVNATINIKYIDE